MEVASMMIVVYILDFDNLDVGHYWGQKISSLKGSTLVKQKVHFATYISFNYIAKTIFVIL